MRRKYLILTMLVSMCVLGSCNNSKEPQSLSENLTSENMFESSSKESSGEVIEVESISFKEKPSKIRMDSRIQLKHEILPSNASDQSTLLTSSNEDVISVINEEEILAKSIGNATLTITTSNGKSDSFEVEVIGPEVFVLNLSAPKEVISIGETMQLEAIPNPEDAVFDRIIFESSNEEIASVSDTGLVSGLRVGEATISAKIQKDDGTFVSGSVKVTVSTIAVESVSINNSVKTLIKGDSLTIEYEILPLNATNKRVSFNSSDESVATVDALGMVMTHKVGNAIISVITEDGNKSDSININVISSYNALLDQVMDKINASEEIEKDLGLSAEYTSHKVNSSSITDIEESIQFYTEDSHLFSNVAVNKKTTNNVQTNTKSFYGFDSDNNKYYFFNYDVDNDVLAQSPSVYDATSADLQNTYKKQAQLIYNDNYRTYGLASYASKIITSSAALGNSALPNDEKNIVVTENNININIQYEPNVTSIYESTILFYDISFTINFNNDGGITSTNYVSKKYNQNSYSKNNHEIIENANPYEVDEQTYTLVYGARSKDQSDFKPNNVLYFSSYEMGLYSSYDAQDEIENIEMNKTFYIRVKSSSPSTASMKLDKIDIKSVTTLEGEINLTKDSFTYSTSGNGYYYAKSNASGKIKITFISTAKKIESELIVEIVKPQPTGIDPYYNGKYFSASSSSIPTLKIDETAVLSANVYPNGANQDYTISASNNNVSLTRQDDGTYVVKALKLDEDNATVVLTWSTINGQNATRTVYIVEPSEENEDGLTLERLQELFATGTYQATVAGINHTYTFNADFTGRAEFAKTYGYFEFTYVIEEKADSFTIRMTCTDVSNEKYVERNHNPYPITIKKESDGKTINIIIDGSYIISGSYKWVSK